MNTTSEMFEKQRLTGVIIAANNNQHKSLAIMAAQAGVHILVEKPAALTVRELDEMTAAAEKAGVTFARCIS